MAWDSFTEVTDAIASALKDDAGLTELCTARWRRAQTVRKSLKLREEVSLTELPIIMITVPAMEVTRYPGGDFDRQYTIRLYCGFQQKAREKAVDELIEYEEKIEQALLNSAALKALVTDLITASSANDEGFNHPAYFLVKEFQVVVERQI